jgi:putative ABC transport system permease protein
MLTPKITAGRGFEAGDTHAVLLNQKLAGKMGVGVGDEIVLEVGDSGKSTWTIVGLIFDITGRDQNTGYFDRDTLSNDLGQSGRATVAEIKTKIATPAAQSTVEKDLRDYFKEKGVSLSFTTSSSKDREQADAQFGILITLLLIMTFLIAVVGSFGLSGTLSINVLERRREIGVMRAVGASSSDVALIFMGEGLLLGVVSWIQAIPISLIAGQYFVQAIGGVINFPAQYYNSMNGIWIWLIIVVVLSLVASWLPARRATQISVRESLAYE